MRFVRQGILIATLLAGSTNADALPLLQLDLEGGVYDSSTQTIVTDDDQFTLYALLTPKSTWSASQIAGFLSATYYVSVAVTPPPGTEPNGSFAFGQPGAVAHTDVVGDMTYGTPPVEIFADLQGSDPGDLHDHTIFPTYFIQVAFQFQEFNRAQSYNTAVAPGGVTTDPTGGSYYATFVGDRTLLNPDYDLHFDLYHSSIALCDGGTADDACRDIDADLYAPFTNDAQVGVGAVASVPEPSGFALVLIGSFSAIGIRRRRSRLQQ